MIYKMKTTNYMKIGCILVSIFLGCMGTDTISTPSFQSEWYEAIAKNKALANITIPHDLDQYPVKVDVQVKVQINGVDHYFTGSGSANRDDDLYYDFGGVVYLYNDKEIVLSTPFFNSRPGFEGGIAFTGSPALYTGPSYISGPYYTGHVRVRAWIALDLPLPVFTTSMAMGAQENYNEVVHNLGYYPDIVSVQTNLSDGYMSDGQGVIHLMDNDKHYNAFGGLLFGYDTTKMRFWVPSEWPVTNQGNGGIFNGRDGWTLGHEYNGTVFVTAWKLDCTDQVFYREETIGTAITHADTFEFPCTYNTTDYLVSVQVRVHNGDGVNGGMMFSGGGTTMATGHRDYGGIVYVYTDQKVMIWRPADNSNGTVVKIGQRWGSGLSSQESTVADVVIRVFHLKPKVNGCPVPEDGVNASYTSYDKRPGGIVVYTCASGLQRVSGDVTRYCLVNLSWHGLRLVCGNMDASNTSQDGLLGLELYRVHRRDTSIYKRSLMSIWDDRLSAIIMGGCASGFLILILLCFILPDLHEIGKHMCSMSYLCKQHTVE